MKNRIKINHIKKGKNNYIIKENKEIVHNKMKNINKF